MGGALPNARAGLPSYGVSGGPSAAHHDRVSSLSHHCGCTRLAYLSGLSTRKCCHPKAPPCAPRQRTQFVSPARLTTAITHAPPTYLQPWGSESGSSSALISRAILLAAVDEAEGAMVV